MSELCSVCRYPSEICKCDKDAWFEDVVVKCDKPSENIDKGSKYIRAIGSETIDIYDVLKIFNITNPAVQHAVKKLLMNGERGYKSYIKDLGEAEWSIRRAIQIEEKYNDNN